MFSAGKLKRMKGIIDMKTEAYMIEKQSQNRGPLWKKIMWLIVIYSASIMALGLVATLFRMMMTAAGMKSH